MRKTIILATVLVLLETLSFGQRHDYYPGADYDPAIPTLEAAVGHDWGDKISSYADIETYAHVLAEHSPKVNLVSYGQTWEGRKLYLLIVSSEANLARLEEIRQRTQQLAYPEGGTPGFDNLPCTVSLMYGIHGNEISSPEAGLLTAYHLAAARNDSLVKSILDNCIVLIDPIENPDGRNRFVQYFEQTRGRWPDENPEAAERNEVWPGGRSNHYLFDMNRDWFALTQPETRGRVATYLKWFPQVVVDLHEMGGDSTYYFAPPAVPINPQMTDTQLNWRRHDLRAGFRARVGAAKIGRHGAPLQRQHRPSFRFLPVDASDRFAESREAAPHVRRVPAFGDRTGAQRRSQGSDLPGRGSSRPRQGTGQPSPGSGHRSATHFQVRATAESTRFSGPHDRRKGVRPRHLLCSLRPARRQARTESAPGIDTHG
ncbi:MAG: M14 family zinc carboxypeptidase [Acidobacteriota bacterium]